MSNVAKENNVEIRHGKYSLTVRRFQYLFDMIQLTIKMYAFSVIKTLGYETIFLWKRNAFQIPRSPPLPFRYSTYFNCLTSNNFNICKHFFFNEGYINGLKDRKLSFSFQQILAVRYIHFILTYESCLPNVVFVVVAVII